MDAVLIATVGAEPQVVTLAADLLVRQGPLVRAVVVHTDAQTPPLTATLPALHSAWAQRADLPPLTLCAVEVADTLTPGELERFADTLFAVLKSEIAAGRRVHLLLAGGRKSIALVGMSVAQLLLGPDDRVWYLHSDEAITAVGAFLAGSNALAH